MKKLIALILAGLMIFTLAACGTPADNEPDETKGNETKAEETKNTK